MRTFLTRLTMWVAAVYLLVPDWVFAAGGGSESALIHVADTRRVSSDIAKYFLDVYNTDPFRFGLECSLITAVLGVSLGFITDFLMKRTGLDLTSRKIVEH